MSTRYVTTPIYYVNNPPHVGHAYTTIAADALTRARRLRGQDAFFLTGTDEHGQNIERIARERGVPEQQHCDEVAARFDALWARLDIRYDRFIRTTSELHRRGVLKLWARLQQARCDDGRPAIYLDRYAGLYCPRCEGFKDEDELRQPGNICPDHELPCEWTEEENLFFRLSAYAGWLRDEISSGRLRLDPEVRRNEILAVIDSGLRDFSVSRARVKWGIQVPEQPDHVLYVWIDALSNYVTALGYGDDDPLYAKFWAGGDPDDQRMHLIGKDIIRFHCLYWPALLHAAGLPAPNRIFAQGFITKNGRKLSKTTGNVIDPEALVERYGPDAVRYFVLREGVYGSDWDFTDEAFVRRHDSDLANDLGNLVSRSLTMARRFCDGKVPARPASPASESGAMGYEVAFQLGHGPLLARALDAYEQLNFSGGLAEVWSWITGLNQAIVAIEPWVLAKDPARRAELDAFLYRLLEGVRLVAVAVAPVMPRAAGRILGLLGQPAEPTLADLAWGRLQPGAALPEVQPLFPRLVEAEAKGKKAQEKTKVSDETTTPAAPAAAPAPAPAATPAAAPAAGPAAAERIDIAEFGKVELRVAQVLEAERIKGSKKLLRLQVDLGDEKRQVVAGIADAYEPEQLVGRKLALVANLKPAKLMGVESNGMVLAASIDGKASLLAVDPGVPVGTKIK